MASCGPLFSDCHRIHYPVFRYLETESSSAFSLPTIIAARGQMVTFPALVYQLRLILENVSNHIC